MTRGLVLVGLIAGLAAAMPPAGAQQPQKKVTHYEPSQRLRTGIETCMQDEAMNGANCVKKCQADFRLDLTSRPPLCIATRPDAKFEAPKPAFTPQEKPAPGKRPPGA